MFQPIFDEEIFTGGLIIEEFESTEFGEGSLEDIIFTFSFSFLSAFYSSISFDYILFVFCISYFNLVL